MLVISKISICGIVNMKPGESKDIPETVAKRLIEVGYAEEAKEKDAVATAQQENDSEMKKESTKASAKRGRKKVEDK